MEFLICHILIKIKFSRIFKIILVERQSLKLTSFYGCKQFHVVTSCLFISSFCRSLPFMPECDDTLSWGSLHFLPIKPVIYELLHADTLKRPESISYSSLDPVERIHIESQQGKKRKR